MKTEETESPLSQIDGMEKFDNFLFQESKKEKISKTILTSNKIERILAYWLLKKENNRLTGAELLTHYSIIQEYFSKDYKSMTIVNTPVFNINTQNGKIYKEDDEVNDEIYKTLHTSNYNLEFNTESKILFDHLYIYSIKLISNHIDNYDIKNMFEFRMIGSNLNKKRTVTFTISDNIINEFNELADELAINKSKFVENSMKNFIQKNK